MVAYMMQASPNPSSVVILHAHTVVLQFSTETQSQLCPDMLVSSREYKQEGVAWGWPSGLRWSLLEDMSSSVRLSVCHLASVLTHITLSVQDNLKITITLLAGKTSSPPRIPPEFFNHKIYCDVAFILPAARSCILAAKPVVARQCAHLHNRASYISTLLLPS